MERDYIKIKELLTNPKYKHIQNKKSRDQLRSLVVKGLVKYKGRKIELNSLEAFIEEENDIIQNHYNLKEATQLLGIKSAKGDKIDAIFSNLGLPIKTINYTIASIRNHRRFIRKEILHQFLEHHKTRLELMKKFPKISTSALLYIEARCNITPIQINGRVFFYRNEDFNQIKEEIIRKQEEEKLSGSRVTLTKEKTLQLLNMTEPQFRRMLKEYRINSINPTNRAVFYLKKDVQYYVQKQEEFWNRHYTNAETLEILGSRSALESPCSLERHKIPRYARYKGLSTIEHAFLKQDVEKRREQRQVEQQLENTSLESHYENFKYRLKLLKISFGEQTKYTKEKWFTHVFEILHSSHAAEKTMNSKIKNFVKVTQLIIKLLKENEVTEIYALTSNDINLFMNHSMSDSTPRRAILCKFLEKVNYDVVEDGYAKKSFNINKINIPKQKKKDPLSEGEQEIYKYDIYKDLKEYVNEFDIHLEKSVRMLIEENDSTYASTWLYVIIHLNNAWRHGDVTSFKRIDLTNIYIPSVQDMINYRVDFQTARLIVNRVRQQELLISKTQVKGYFICSDDLAEAFATVVLLLESYYQQQGSNHPFLINFNTKYNMFTDRHHKVFFSNFNHKDNFSFSSRKMNETLMTIIYILLAQQEKGEKSATLVKLMRRHKDVETIKHYVHIPKEEFHFLTKQLFQRGEFGFIPDLFLEKVLGKSSNREKRTNEIIELTQKFGDIFKIESTAGFMNEFDEKQKSVVDYIRGKTLEEATRELHLLYTEQLPSRNENVHCLFGKSGCKNTHLENCFHCPYAIPTFYALSSLGESIVARIKDYVNETRTGMKLKKSNLIHLELKLLSEAIKEFGKEIVYDFIKPNAEEFRALVNQVPYPKEIDSRFMTLSSKRK
ncbi:TPA: hypothetical protein ACGW5B_001328 [Bacillus paranthracis]|nr:MULTISPECIES: hypothetical protein [Bacillus cereus group]MDA2663955.1 hypothetical protein [Bacillus cereus group sp. Bc032]MDA2674610.1 hypothetical protein [Bacillus cereus group sp. Bc031]MDA2679962.1 hypothetical protein [Bacillus cereus group sp. Bc029]MDA2685611.1 hypothetical protein [Bacillus cereus group sp. Bc030]MDA2741007.1 hypothetical protein [Bacillus cereus group sp. Bc011]